MTEVAGQIVPVWERRPGEPDNAWAAFVFWRDSANPRSMNRAAEHAGISKTDLRHFKYKFEWEARVRHYDKWRAQHKYEDKRQKIASMNEAHGKLARAGLNIVTRKLRSINDASLDEMPWRDVIALFRFCVEIERSAGGTRHVARNVPYRADRDADEDTGT